MSTPGVTSMEELVESILEICRTLNGLDKGEQRIIVAAVLIVLELDKDE